MIQWRSMHQRRSPTTVLSLLVLLSIASTTGATERLPPVSNTGRPVLRDLDGTLVLARPAGYLDATFKPTHATGAPTDVPPEKSSSPNLILPVHPRPEATTKPSTGQKRQASLDKTILGWTPLDDFSRTNIVDERNHPAGAKPGYTNEAWVYDTKSDVPTQRPWLELGRDFYGTGITPPGLDLFGPTNLARPQFYLYGDMRTGIAGGRNAIGRTDNWASRLNLDADLRLTDSERFHAFIGPLDDGANFSRWELVSGDLRYRSEMDFTPVTAFFEGDLGAMVAGAQGMSSPAEIPFTIGLVPLLFQNGIWMEDAVTGAAFTLPSRHSRLLNWSNYDATFFAIFDQLNSPAFGADNNAAQAFGTAWFIEAYDGYIEAGYAYVRDRNVDRLRYHNLTVSYTRRYLDRISNGVRLIVNTGQDGPRSQRTADGALLLFESSYITANPLTFVPYFNAFVGWDRPQSVARAGVSGGILRNSGINFETDGLNGYATLDPTGHDTAGFTVGVDLIGEDLDRQWLVEMAFQTEHGSLNPRVDGDQYAIGTRYQIAINHRRIIRFDAMHGWRGNLDRIYGTRMEYRWKF
ncbi:MAG: hypothetical protein AAF664_10810 [Planctomycetota bacterium]